MDLLGHHTIELTCECGEKVEQRLGRLKDQPDFPCARCGRILHVDLSEVTELEARLNKELDSLGKTLTLKL